MTLQRWITTMVVFGFSLGTFSYCVLYVQNAWGMVSLAFLFLMAFRALVDTVDLCCGRLIRGEARLSPRPIQVQAAGRHVATVRRIILEETDVYQEG